ncbi:MAG: hypothetical protein MZV63_46865 [Marinilabiliales bacterium]|nr:hypothetical protein [Marinilabiliales bacterium]
MHFCEIRQDVPFPFEVGIIQAGKSGGNRDSGPGRDLGECRPGRPAHRAAAAETRGRYHRRPGQPDGPGDAPGCGGRSRFVEREPDFDVVPVGIHNNLQRLGEDLASRRNPGRLGYVGLAGNVRDNDGDVGVRSRDRDGRSPGRLEDFGFQGFWPGWRAETRFGRD